MDGTLVDSTAGVQGAWETFAESYPGIDLREILSCEYLPAFPFLKTAAIAVENGLDWIGSDLI